jgi:hypothetical protein
MIHSGIYGNKKYNKFYIIVLLVVNLLARNYKIKSAKQAAAAF